MPASAEEGRSMMMSWMRAQNPHSVLDIGAGSGTYGRLFRNGGEPVPYLIGVEVWHPYLAKFELTRIYDYMISQDIRALPLGGWPRADVVILGDVLEHMSEKDAVEVWTLARDLARKAVYLSIPIINYPQGALHDNPFEEHVVPDWSDERVLDTFHGITWKWLGTIVGRYEAVST